MESHPASIRPFALTLPMDEIRLTPVTLAELSGIRHETFTSEVPPFEVPEFLVVQYFGVYRDGSAGRGDALYIVATATAARSAWYSRCTVLDFRELRYSWGDEMEWVTSIGWNVVIKCHEPLRIVVGAECQAGLQSLLQDEYDTFCAESVEQAFARCRDDRQEFEHRLREHQGRA